MVVAVVLVLVVVVVVVVIVVVVVVVAVVVVVTVTVVLVVVVVTVVVVIVVIVRLSRVRLEPGSLLVKVGSGERERNSSVRPEECPYSQFWDGRPDPGLHLENHHCEQKGVVPDYRRTSMEGSALSSGRPCLLKRTRQCPLHRGSPLGSRLRIKSWIFAGYEEGRCGLLYLVLVWRVITRPTTGSCRWSKRSRSPLPTLHLWSGVVVDLPEVLRPVQRHELTGRVSDIL